MARYKQFDKSVLISIKIQAVYFTGGEEEGSMETLQILGKY